MKVIYMRLIGLDKNKFFTIKLELFTLFPSKKAIYSARISGLLLLFEFKSII